MIDDQTAESTDGTRDNVFIVTSSPTKAKGATRKLIRSHVMRGKNRRRKLVPSQVLCGSWLNSHTQDTQPNQLAQKYNTLSIPTLECSIPRLSTSHFADELQPCMFDLIDKFFDIIVEAMYPTQICHTFNPHNTIWFTYLHTSPMYIHSQIWISSTYFDFLHNNRAPSPSTISHEIITLNLLRQRILDPVIEDETLAVVVTLVNMTALRGKGEEARSHMRGLERMVDMRGGMRGLDGQLGVKICRADLSTSLITGTKPLLFSSSSSPTSHQSFLPNPHHSKETILTHLLDPSLLPIYQDLLSLSFAANLSSSFPSSFHTRKKLDPTIFQELLISTQYRLSHLQHHFPQNPASEVLRLSLLAFSTTILLQPRGLKVRFEYLSQWLREAVVEWDVFENLEEGVRIWCMMIAAIVAVTEEDDEWILPRLNKGLEGKGWEDVRRDLKGVLWIDCLLDEDGKKVFERAIRWDAGNVG